MKIEIFIDAHKDMTDQHVKDHYRWGFYILTDDEEKRQHTLFDSEAHESYDTALAEACSAAKWLFPDVEVAGIYPAPGMVEGDLRTV